MSEEELESLSLDELEYTVLIDHAIRLLIIDDEDVIREFFSAMFQDSGIQLDFAATGTTALELLGKNTYNLLIVDKNLPDFSGLQLIENARDLNPDAVSIVITGYSSYDSAVEALRLGASDYLEKPFSNINLVQEKIQQALKKQRLAYENRVLADHLRTALQELKMRNQAATQPSPVQPAEKSEQERLQTELQTLKKELRSVSDLLFQASSRFTNLIDRRTIDRQELTYIQAILEKACIQIARRTMGNK